jgi:hypothetical protein
MTTEPQVLPVVPWEPRTLGWMQLGKRVLLICLCGQHHDIVATAYGARAQCDELNVRWTTIGNDDFDAWIPEPYVTMHGRPT